MTTTADLVLDHVRVHGRIADLGALARAAGRSPKAVLHALSGLKARARVSYVLWDMPIRILGEEPVVHRDVKPANEVAKGELMAEVDDVQAVGAEVVHPAEPSIVVAKGDTDDAPAIAAEVVEAFIVVDRKKKRLRGFQFIEDACESQHKDLPRGHGVVRVSDGKWMSRMMQSGWGQPKADEEEKDDDG